MCASARSVPSRIPRSDGATAAAPSPPRKLRCGALPKCTRGTASPPGVLVRAHLLHHADEFAIANPNAWPRNYTPHGRNSELFFLRDCEPWPPARNAQNRSPRSALHAAGGVRARARARLHHAAVANSGARFCDSARRCLAAAHRGHTDDARLSDSEGIRTPAGRAQWISSPSP